MVVVIVVCFLYGFCVFRWFRVWVLRVLSFVVLGLFCLFWYDESFLESLS